MGELVRLQKIMAHAGCGSRRACERFIEEGRVTVDGVVVQQLGSKADPETQSITLDGEKVAGPGRRSKTVIAAGEHVYHMLNKPRGVLSTNEDPSGRPLAIQLVPEKRRIFCVGRLDRDTEGLLLLTNDGELTNQLTHPRFGIEKTYMAKVSGAVSAAQIAKLERGVHLAEGRTQGARVRVRKRMGQSSTLELTISEGMNRQVRRILAAVGLACRQLRRVAIGPLRLGDLPVGMSRPLAPEELVRLRAAIRHAEAAASARGARRGPPSRRDEERRPRPDERGGPQPSAEPPDEFLEEDLEEEDVLEQQRALEAAETTEDTGPSEGEAQEDEEMEEEAQFEEEKAPVPASKTRDRGAPDEHFAEPDQDRERPKRRPADKKRRPWEHREHPGERGASKPWERHEHPAKGGAGKPWERHEHPAKGGAGKPWERRERPAERGAGKPWERRERSPERGAGRPWEHRGERSQQPCEKHCGPSGGRDTTRPWERGAHDKRSTRPWEKRERGERSGRQARGHGSQRGREK
ncbi:MAG: pseudouridine synthase [Planctomycetota bacterium]|nr:pseudouridine synthase [Planctomycetota bacterium]